MSKENRLVLGLIIIAYIFSYFFHTHFWIDWASKISQFIWHGQVMINNPDGYFYGSGVQKIVYHEHLYNPRLLGVWHYGTSVITAFLAKFFHINIDTLMLYLPAVISSLVVIPIILIGKLYKNLTWGFLAALIGSIGWSYYNRTLAGYYDTDMFSASLPMFILYFLLASIKNRSLNYLLAAAFTIILYPFLYDQGLSIVYAMGIMAFIYLIFTKDNKLSINLNDEFVFKFIIILSIALMDINWIIRIVLLIGVYYLFKIKEFKLRGLQISALVFFILFLFTGNVFGIILNKIFSYSTSTEAEKGLQFLNVNKTVREAGHIPWYIVFDRIIGSTLGIIIALVGYILLIKRYKEFIIALPLWGIGFFAFIGGLRFTVYAVPIAAISGVYFFVWLAEKWKMENEKWKITISVIGSVFLIAPNISHIAGCCEKNKFLASISKIYPLSSYPYLTPTVFNKNEVEVLDKLKKLSNPKDYVITWWDYGYPIWYYADVNTLVDGGKHNEDNFLVSKILTTSNQFLAANLSKLAIKKYVETNKTVATQLFIKNGKPIDVNGFLDEVGSKEYKAPKLDRNVYLMFPYRMFNIYPTVAVFSNRNLNTGEIYPNHFFYKNRIRKQGNYLLVGNIPVDLRTAEIILRNRIPVKELDISFYDKDGKLKVKKQHLRNEGLNLIILQNYREALIVDDYYYNSTFIQMFVFENYDKNLFEPVILNPMIKIYKIK
ncbi:dolichyl-diphosphooligosaccharide--protein glycosyltransferase [Lebetimonas natsushimae]|uniref:Dolichyl-diphosphooligosaccharide--protein glycosyltransferase n=1 Tax=Lebetimonas natsushimae TaxID=1936991 RepID=A0A292YBE8_9BACT|nr:STT3 domain-containing protein [Lebetimonas natsushimae]GAX86859.1 dolichyl-diphosphooligosaccharide--protein glycosyltransferase [Lebetimonas natsushimae]